MPESTPVATPPAEPPAATPPATPPAAPAATPPATPPAAPPTTLLTKEPPSPTPGTPAAEIKVTFPEGMKADDAFGKEFLDTAKAAKLDSDAAQKLVDLHGKVLKSIASSHMEQVTKWAEEAKGDPEIGGAKFDQNLALAKKTLDRVASPGLKEVLTTSGLGNHKEVIKLFATIGAVISEDRLPGGGAPAPQGSREAAVKDAFPNSPGMFGGQQ